MLVQKALRELDEEINRLTRIRDIVATLHTTSSPLDAPVNSRVAEPAQAPTTIATLASHVVAARVITLGVIASDVITVHGVQVAPVENAAADPDSPQVQRLPGRKLRMERTTRMRRPLPPVTRALGGEIPVKPVFIASGPPQITKTEATANGASGAAKRLSAPLAPEGTLDALLRELAHRPSPGF